MPAAHPRALQEQFVSPEAIASRLQGSPPYDQYSADYRRNCGCGNLTFYGPLRVPRGLVCACPKLSSSRARERGWRVGRRAEMAITRACKHDRSQSRPRGRGDISAIRPQPQQVATTGRFEFLRASSVGTAISCKPAHEQIAQWLAHAASGSPVPSALPRLQDRLF